ncbi:MAG: hypothetical protein GX929_03555 [Clostridiales bacterium]|jgi:hypothetical protein|nr:hypothetical protein [Clostridiales bacterium]
MDWSRAKNIIIGMLLLVNVFLLGMYGYLRYTEDRIWNESVAGAAAYLERQGIALDTSLIPRESLRRGLRVIVRDRAAESAAAHALLGDAEVTGSGGNDRYRSAVGSLSWLSGGTVEAQLAASVLDGEGSVQEMLGHAGISAAVFDTDSLTQQIDGLPVFNCTLTLTRDASSCALQGRYCFGTPQAVDTGVEMELPGLLIAYASAMRSFAIERITALDPGWVVQTLPGIGVRLIPVWRITASDTVTYINALDGSVVLEA